MASIMRYRSGECRPISVQTAPLVNGVQLFPIECGDLVGYATIVYNSVTYFCVVPANAAFVSGFTSITTNGNTISSGQLFTSAANFYKAFAGVALHKSGLQSGETSFKLTTDLGYQLIATSGCFEYDCASTTWKPNDLVKVAVTSSVPQNQTVASGGIASTDAIGWASPPYNQLGQAATSILVQIRPQTGHGEITSGA